jgi:hypothetical protein
MHGAAAAAKLDRMPQMQHLMIDEIFNGIERNARRVKNAADDDGVMRGIIVAQTSQGLVTAPGHLWSSHKAVEEAKIQVVKNLVEIIVLAVRTLNALASAQLTNELRLLRHGMTAGVLAITRGVGSVNGLAMQLGNEDMEDGIQHWLGRAFQQIREADEDPSLAQANSAIDVGKAIETDLKFRHGRARAQIAICLLKNLGKVGSHVDLVLERSGGTYYRQAEKGERRFECGIPLDPGDNRGPSHGLGVKKELFLFRRAFLIVRGFHIFARHISIGLE